MSKICPTFWILVNIFWTLIHRHSKDVQFKEMCLKYVHNLSKSLDIFWTIASQLSLQKICPKYQKYVSNVPKHYGHNKLITKKLSKFWTFFGHIFNFWQGPTYETSTNLWLHTSKGKYWCNSGCVLVPSIFTLVLVTWIISLDGVTLHSTNTAVICLNFDNNFKDLLCGQKAGLPSAFVKKCAAAS